MTDGRGRPQHEDVAGNREVTARLSVPEMDCPSCARTVDARLDRVDGVSEVELLPTTGTATITFDPAAVSRAEVVAAIGRAGYEVVDDQSRSADDVEELDDDAVGIAPPTAVWTSPRAGKTWIGAVLLVLGLLVEFVVLSQNVTVITVIEYPFDLAAVLFLGAIAASGVPVIRAGYYSARSRSLDIDLLMATAIVAATAIGYYVEAATLAVLFSIAELLETYAMDRARDSLRELLRLSPEEATVRREGEEVTVPVDEVDIGETVLIRPGEKIPLDGTVIEGTSAVDESPITGESIPIDTGAGDDVYAGSINEAGYLEIAVTSVAADSTLSRIIEMVQGAQAKRTETERFVDRFAGYYTPVVVVLAVLTVVLPPLFIADPISVGAAGYGVTFVGTWEVWFIRGLTLLVIACPCAFVISTPVSVVSGITSAAKNGVLIKGGNHLEAMGEVKAVALDKTGTLTKGQLVVTDVVPVGDSDERELLHTAASVEQRSEHPIAGAVLERATAAGVADLAEPTAFESLPGKGVRADLDGATVYAGNPALFESLGFDLSRLARATDGGSAPEGLETRSESATGSETALAGELQPAGATQTAGETRTASGAQTAGETGPTRGSWVDDFADQGKTVVIVGTETGLIGAIAIADEVRPAARRAVERLSELGVERVVMLTGDNEGTARAIAAQVGVDEYRAGLLPDEKVAAIEQLQARYGVVAMVGDGINDAPALATAEVGIVMGAAGTDTALETADIALMGDDLSRLPYLYSLSRTARDVIRQNIWTSLGVKFLLALGVPLGLVSVALAVVVGDMGMSLGVTGNAMRLSRVTPENFLEE